MRAVSDSARRIWFGDGMLAAMARAALAIPSAVFAGVVAARNAMYDRGVLPTHASPLPGIAIGNVTVGGTGKTPIAGEVARRMAARGARPAILLRGVGGDEAVVHRALVPAAIVIADPDRVRGAERARAAGADIAVLDDAFQHRRIARAADIVLMAAEDAGHPVRLLPAGPYREPLPSLRRAALVVITRKRASDEDVERAVARANDASPGVPVAIVRFSLTGLRGISAREPLTNVQGKPVLAIAGIGDPESFAAQLRNAGADVTLARFADHHPYTAEDGARLAAQVPADGIAVCTLKDFVKLSKRWPVDAAPLWYASQGVHIERGEATLDALIDRALALRTTDTTTARRSPAAH